MKITKFNIHEITEYLCFCHEQGFELGGNGIWYYSDEFAPDNEITNEELISKYIYHFQLKKP